MRFQAGISLVEILLVVAVLGVVATIVLPSSSNQNVNKLATSTQEVVQALRFAREDAVAQQSPRGVSIDSTQRRVRLFTPDEGVSPWSPVYDVYHPLRKQIYDVQLDQTNLGRVDTIALTPNYVSTCTTPTLFYFDTAGFARCLDPNGVLLKELTIELSVEQLTFSIEMSGITGRVTY